MGNTLSSALHNSPHARRYRSIAKGQGGTFDFNDQTAEYIGTSQCNAGSVGVYFALSNETCFAAHIEVQFRNGVTPQGSSSRLSKDIKKGVNQALWGECRRCNWGDLHTEGERRSRVLKSLVITSADLAPQDSVASGLKHDIAAAIIEWLVLPQNQNINIMQAQFGFIVRHPGRNRRYFRLVKSHYGKPRYFENEPNPQDWAAVEDREAKSWVINVADRGPTRP